MRIKYRFTAKNQCATFSQLDLGLLKAWNFLALRAHLIRRQTSELGIGLNSNDPIANRLAGGADVPET